MTDVQIQESQVTVRRGYSAPQLMQYGLVSDLTASGSQPGKEGPGVGNAVRKP